MSIPFRLKCALGLLPSADQLDAKWEKLIKMRDDLNEMERSEELKQFKDLKNLIESSDFQHKKRKMESLQFAGSHEDKLLKEYKTLAGSYAIKNYHKILDSDRLVRFQNILSGPALKRFVELQKVVESVEFGSRRAALKKKEFIKTPDYHILKEFNQLRKSGDIIFWRKFSRSERYLTYLKTIESKDLKRFGELKIFTTTKEFNDKIAYLKDKKRFLKSEQYKDVLTFNAIDKGKFMADYRKLKRAKELDFFEKWEIAFEANFTEKKLDNKYWQPENWIAFRTAGKSFSQKDEMQGFNGEKNIELNNKTLSIWAKKEKIQGTVWDPSVGLLPKQYEYTSAILNSAASFRLKDGIIETKARFKKDPSITSAFTLTGESTFPQVDLFRSGKNGVGMGVIEHHGGKSSKYVHLGGLNDDHYHIFRLEILGNHFVWKINGSEVHSSTVSMKEPLFIHMLTTLHGEVNEHLLPHRFEVDWIRSFSKKS
ncbi:MAG: glycoside hydrolase family 16 protein [Prolixibacteraceae bacterium]|nr:glycoside hydrolase family 16 protein [Prolixibacteraceae bacterium]